MPYNDRGWPSLEQGASWTIAAHLAKAEKLGHLPKRFALAQASRPKVINIDGDEPTEPDITADPEEQLHEAVCAIDAAHFASIGEGGPLV